MISSFKSDVLQQLWTTGDMSLLPSTYAYEVAEVLTLLSAANFTTDLALLGAYLYDENKPDNWAVAITVNNLEPIGSVTCHFINGQAYDVDLNEYN